MKLNLPALWRFLSAALLMAILMLVLGNCVKATAQVVTNTSDSGAGTLRDAINNATNNSVITFDPSLSGQTILLTSDTLTIQTNLTIDASALPGGIQINGNGSVGVIDVTSNCIVVLNSLTITNGDVWNGAGIYNAGTLTLNECILSGNMGGYGSGIYNIAMLTLNKCTLWGNSANADDFSSGGGIYNEGTLTLNESTLSGNSAVYGGGVYNAGTLTVNQCTLSGNNVNGYDPNGGGIFNNGGILTVANTIIAGNSASSGGGNGLDIFNSTGSGTLEGSNIVQSIYDPDSGISGNTPINANPDLATLGNYGGPTPTMLPVPGSPAIDSGSDSATNTFATDQRGYPRLEGLHVDIGAVESSQSSPVFTNANSGYGSLRFAITYATNGTVITFDPSMSGTTITLASTLTINTNLTIDASALPGGIQINGNGAVQIFYVTSNCIVVLNSLTITNGLNKICGGIYNLGALTLNQCTLSGNGGYFSGAIRNVGTLTLNQSTLSGNIANDVEGGGIGNVGQLTINQSTLSGNTGNFDGGGIANYGTLILFNSIVAGNSAGSSGDIFSYNGITYNGSNIVQSFGNSGGTITGPAPITNTPALLDPLGNYGGPTQTMPPLPGSPAISAGGIVGNTFTNDQRGYPRTQNGLIDIGAVELPIIQFTASPTNGPIGLGIQFTCPSVDSDGSAISQWNWNFSDSNTGITQSPSHIYSSTGSFAPSLVVTNNLGLTLAATGPSITVSPSIGITGVSLSGSNLTINGSNGVFGLTYYVLMTTNLALSRNQWLPVATNTFIGNGNFNLIATNAVNPSAPKRFYILQVP